MMDVMCVYTVISDNYVDLNVEGDCHVVKKCKKSEHTHIRPFQVLQSTLAFFLLVRGMNEKTKNV